MGEQIEDSKELARTFGALEINMSICALAMRKLIESGGVTAKASSRRFTIPRFKSNLPKESVALAKELPGVFPGKIYDLNTEETIEIPLKQICDLLIHSSFFSPRTRDHAPDGVLLNSHWSRGNWIFDLKLETWDKCMSWALSNNSERTVIKFCDDGSTHIERQ